VIDWITVGFSLFGGAGGALLLDLWWKPRRARQRAAVLLHAEIEANSKSIRERLPKSGQTVGMHPDLLLPTIAWEAVSTDVSEFPVNLADQVVRLYHLYAEIIQYHELLSESLEEYSDVEFRKVEEAQENFRVVEQALSAAMTEAIQASEVLLPGLDRERAMSMLPGRRPRLTP
jgi:hypothetical protein